MNNPLVTPFLKWVGGKRQLLSRIRQLLPPGGVSRRPYVEPFVGGGAVLFALHPRQAIINDYNEELINAYRVIREHPDELIEDLRKHANTASYFYEIRGLDRTPHYKQLTDIQRASRMIYLNKTCYNGLYRINNAGKFNSPYGRYKNPNIVNDPVIRAVSRYLRESDIRITHGDYAALMEEIPEGAFVYLDPPYHPLSETSSFTGYIQGGWSAEDQIRLSGFCDELDRRGVLFLLSNSATPLIRDLYSAYHIHTVQATRSVNSVAAKRGAVDELLICNYRTSGDAE